jgi:excisionase family DNA binding protein
MSAATLELPETINPPAEDVQLAKESSRRLAPFLSAPNRRAVKVHVEMEGAPDEVRVSIPPSAFRLLMAMLTEIGRGNAVTFIPIHAELTTQQAADILNVSRPFLIGLLKKGVIQHHKVGSHRRVRFQDLLDYKRKVDQERQKSLDELAAQAQELGMGY